MGSTKIKFTLSALQGVLFLLEKKSLNWANVQDGRMRVCGQVSLCQFHALIDILFTDLKLLWYPF